MVDDVAFVVRWDQRGAGRSDAAGPFTVDRFVADLDAVLSAYGLESAVIAGHSWGAGLSLRYGLRHPNRARALLLVSGTDAWWSQHREAYRQARLSRLGPDVNAAINAETSSEDEAALVEACRSLDVPALVVHGLDDPRPAEGPRSLAEALPRGRFVGLRAVGHVPWAEHPSVLCEALRPFLVVVEADGSELDSPVGRVRLSVARADETAVVVSVLDEAAAWLGSRAIQQWPARFRLDTVEPAVQAGEVWLARSVTSGAAVGTFWLNWDDPLWPADDAATAGYVHRLAVRRSCAGLGGALLDWAGGLIARAGRRFLRLDCLASNVALRQYYLDRGFSYRGDVEVRGSPGQRATSGPAFVVSLLERPLGPAPS